MADAPRKPLTGDSSKDQVLRCIMELASRAEELGYKDLASTLCVTVVAEIRGDGKLFADLTGMFAKTSYPELSEHIQTLPDEEEKK